MPKARRSSCTMAFKIKVIAEAETVENNSGIAWDYGLSESMARRWRSDPATILSGEHNVCKTCKNGPFHSQVSRTRRASDGVVFTGEIPNISFVMWIELSKIVFQWVGSKESNLWSEMRCCHDSFRACHVKSAAVTEFTRCGCSHEKELTTDLR